MPISKYGYEHALGVNMRITLFSITFLMLLFSPFTFAQQKGMGLNPYTNKGMGLSPYEAKRMELSPEEYSKYVNEQKMIQLMQQQELMYEAQREQQEQSEKRRFDAYNKLSPKIRDLKAQQALIQIEGPCTSSLQALVNQRNTQDFSYNRGNGGQFVIVKEDKTLVYTDKGLVTIDGRSCNVDSTKNKTDAVYEIISNSIPSKKVTDTIKPDELSVWRKNWKAQIDTLNNCDAGLGRSQKTWDLLKERKIVESSQPSEKAGNPRAADGLR